MKSLIINNPNLQTRQQKIGSLCIATFSWLLWVYFLLPLFTLAGWLMGVKSLATEVRWFGGYKTLLELLQMYGSIIAAIALLWLCWTLCTAWRKSTLFPSQQTALDDQILCEYFHVTAPQLKQGKRTKIVTVSFDDAGQITGIVTN